LLYSSIRATVPDEPSFLALAWADVRALYAELAEIKGSASPNFPSKAGHFIFPRLFRVMDHQATGVEDYGSVWSSMRGAWTAFQQQEQATDVLRDAILEVSRRPVHDLYPIEIKIIELCSIGRRHAHT
jgi:hypothetical protein